MPVAMNAIPHTENAASILTPMNRDSFDDETERAAEYLRMALPLMSQHHVPATPPNYTIWYSYVSGEAPELRAEIDRRVEQNVPFDRSACKELYSRFAAESEIETVETIRSGLGQLLTEVGSALAEAGSEANAFESSLGEFVETASEGGNFGDFHGLLDALITETRAMRASTKEMQSQFESKSAQIEELEEQLQHERRRAITDPLTGLNNRAALIDQLTEAVNESGPDSAPSIVMLDIDHFKKINDSHGHLIGDRVIRFVAEVLTKNIKGKDTAARFGGEEFTLLLPATRTQGAAAVAESIRSLVAAAKLVRADNKKPIGQVTLSAGVATHVQGEDIMELINRADQALYQAKNSGRNQVRIA